MAITDLQKTDYLWKKVGFSVAKTDYANAKSASNESIASPLVLRADSIWQQSGSIPSAIPAANTSIITVYNDTANTTVQATNDGTAQTNRTWLTGLTNWVDASFGSTYQVKVYIANTGWYNAQTSGTQVFADGSGNQDEWFFDYSSGVLNFMGNNLPTYANLTPISFSGKSVYVSGARYTGQTGLATFVANTGVANNLTISGNLTTLGNVVVNGNLVTSNIFAASSNANIAITPGINGYVSVNTTSALQVPVGSATQYPVINRVGMLRWNTDYGYLEVYTGSTWEAVGLEGGSAIVTSDIFTGNGSASFGPLSQSLTTTGAIVTINGVLQLPSTSYSIAANTITFTETPVSTDIIEVRGAISQKQLNFMQNGNANLAIQNVSGIDTLQFVDLNKIKFSVDTSNVNIFNSLQLTGPLVSNVSNIAINTTTSQLDSFSPTKYRTAKYLISGTDTTDNYYQSAEAMIVHNGSTATISTYNVVATNTQFFTLSANVYSGNVTLWATTTASTNFKISNIYIPV
jgi:hypothetical protein